MFVLEHIKMLTPAQNPMMFSDMNVFLHFDQNLYYSKVLFIIIISSSNTLSYYLNIAMRILNAIIEIVVLLFKTAVLGPLKLLETLGDSG